MKARLDDAAAKTATDRAAADAAPPRHRPAAQHRRVHVLAQVQRGASTSTGARIDE